MIGHQQRQMTQTRSKQAVRKQPRSLSDRRREEKQQERKRENEETQRRLRNGFRRYEIDYLAEVQRHLKVKGTEHVTAWRKQQKKNRLTKAYAEIVASADAAGRGWAATRMSRRAKRVQRKVDEMISRHDSDVPVNQATYSEMYDVATAADMYISDAVYHEYAVAEVNSDVGQLPGMIERMALDSDEQSDCGTELLCSETMSQADPGDMEDLAGASVQVSDLYSPSQPTSDTVETAVPIYDPAAPHYVIAPERTSSSSGSSSSSEDEGLSSVEPCGGLTALAVD